ncbi:hypothetical protein KR222_002701 [Zaprionus bogoriensis]|nr:hypothetical protein KR222_002701 [Zaprionus bogoriensis]
MGATMVKNGNFLDALPSQVILIHYIWRNILTNAFTLQGTLHVVMLGLDSAGKTTALYRLKFDQYLNTVPTIGFNCEKVQCNMGKAKGVHFLVWDVGGQEKLRPLWRSYTRCTDGILFVVDSVDTERMEEAKMELMRTAKCPDNQGVPVLILANKQDLPNACCPKELEKLLGLNEMLNSMPNISTDNTVANENHIKKKSKSKEMEDGKSDSKKQKAPSLMEATCATATRTSTTTLTASPRISQQNQQRSWYIQPACAITGEGLQEGLVALYDMILKRRKINKSHKKQKR